jgi:hypothetical protein
MVFILTQRRSFDDYATAPLPEVLHFRHQRRFRSWCASYPKQLFPDIVFSLWSLAPRFVDYGAVQTKPSSTLYEPAKTGQ